MNRRMIAYITGKMLLVEAGLLLLPAITAIVHLPDNAFLAMLLKSAAYFTKIPPYMVHW